MNVAFIFAAYYAVPVRKHGIALVSGVVVTLLAVALLGWGIAGQLRRHLLRGEPVGLPSLITLIAGVVAAFSLGYYRLELTSPAQMEGLKTKTDSLYFTIQLLTTVGLGDVSAQGQLARGLALVQMAFDVVFIAVGGSLLAGSIKDALRPREPPGEGTAHDEE